MQLGVCVWHCPPQRRAVGDILIIPSQCAIVSVAYLYSRWTAFSLFELGGSWGRPEERKNAVWVPAVKVKWHCFYIKKYTSRNWCRDDGRGRSRGQYYPRLLWQVTNALKPLKNQRKENVTQKFQLLWQVTKLWMIIKNFCGNHGKIPFWKCDKYGKCGKSATYTANRGARANRWTPLT